MITPAGKECRFYYQDFHRGHSLQECRIVQANPKSKPWKPTDCQQCPVPEILLANSSPDLVLEGGIKAGLMGMNRRMEVKAFCSKHLVDVPEPQVGCRQCALEKPGLRELFGEE
ncbi:MAG TPA: hypothetical protein PLD25_01580 [Chloroflexota bacterium]|nr:hypothetical protein [Chloroflexota bacterium]